MTDTRTTWNAEALHAILHDPSRPVLLTGGTVITLDPLVGTVRGDLLLGGPTVVGVGPGLVTAAADDGAIVVDATDTTIVPAVVDGPALAGARAGRSARGASLAPGRRGDVLVLAGAADPATGLRTLVEQPHRVRALLVDGAPVLWDGADVPGRPEARDSVGPPPARDLAGDPRLGTWIDTTGFLHQELTSAGRYDETRGGRPHAYEGRFWLDGDRIDYLDDLGFWAFGEFVGDELHHAGYVMRLAEGTA